MAANSEEMVEDTGNLAENDTDVLSAEGYISIEKLLNGKGVRVLLSHHRNIIQTIEVRERLEVVLVLDQLLGTAVEEADVRVSALDDLTVELQYETEHTVCRGMLWAKIDREVLNLATKLALAKREARKCGPHRESGRYPCA